MYTHTYGKIAKRKKMQNEQQSQQVCSLADTLFIYRYEKIKIYTSSNQFLHQMAPGLWFWIPFLFSQILLHVLRVHGAVQ